jgi:hypothetical protein
VHAAHCRAPNTAGAGRLDAIRSLTLAQAALGLAVGDGADGGGGGVLLPGGHFVVKVCADQSAKSRCRRGGLPVWLSANAGRVNTAHATAAAGGRGDQGVGKGVWRQLPKGEAAPWKGWALAAWKTD